MIRTLPPWAFMALNIVGFQAVWLLCVYGAGQDYCLPGIAAAIAFAAASLAFSPEPRKDMQTLALGLPLGALMDTLLLQTGILKFSHCAPFTGFAPVWILALWLGFALTLNHSLKRIYAHPLPLFLFGFIGAPVAYFIAAYRFDAMRLESDYVTGFLAIGLVWGLGLIALRSADNRLTQLRAKRA